MNANEQAQKGFKTFILTLSISLIVFSVVYYLISNNSSFEQDSMVNGETQPQEQVKSDAGTSMTNTQEVAAEQPTEEPVMAAVESGTQVEPQVAGTADEKSVFEHLAVQTATTNQTGTVLAGASESTQSTVPSTGVTSVTLGLISSLLLFFGVMIFMSRDPRSLAMSGFEKKAVK